MGLHLAKAHAYGNDFLYACERGDDHRDWAGLARVLCARQTGIGADGLIVYAPTPDGARMRLWNADGSVAEVSGNGVRGLGALLVWEAARTGRSLPSTIVIDTQAGDKTLMLLGAEGSRATFRAAMGQPEGLTRERLDVGGESVSAVIMQMGNPQCVLIEPLLDDGRYRRLGPILERHPRFSSGTNVEFARVTSPDRVEILIWERGVGPTSSSGTGSCAAAVAASVFGGAARVVDVVAPGGAQRVEWTEQGVFLTGWAELLWEGEWIP